MFKDMLPNVPKTGGPENKFYRVANASKIPDHVQGEERVYSVRLVNVTKVLASVNKAAEEEHSRV